MEAPPRLRECPNCGASCPGLAEICFSCKQVLPDLPAFQFSEEDVAWLRQQIESNPELRYPSRDQQPGKFRARTVVIGTLAWSLTLLTCLGGSAAGGVGMGFLMGLILMVPLVNDLATPGARGRRNAAAAVRCYFRSLRLRRWNAAFACLSPLAYERAARLPPLPELGIQELEAKLDSPDGVRAYWRQPAQGGGDTTRYLAAIKVVPGRDDGKLVRVTVRLTLCAFPRWVFFFVLFGILPAVAMQLIMQRRSEHSFEVLAYAHRGQWWIWRGDLPSGISR